MTLSKIYSLVQQFLHDSFSRHNTYISTGHGGANRSKIGFQWFVDLVLTPIMNMLKI